MMLSGNLARLLCLVMAPRVNTRQAKWAFFFAFLLPPLPPAGSFSRREKRESSLLAQRAHGASSLLSFRSREPLSMCSRP